MINIIEVEKVSKIFKKNKKNFFAVKDISFYIKKGEIVGLIGKNGAGKSTLIKLISGILLKDSGLIKIDGLDPFLKRKEVIKNIGVIFGQKSQLIWDLKVRESFFLTRCIYKIEKENYLKRLTYLEKLFEIEKILDVPVKELSLGQRMKCEIVNTILPMPKLLYLDEATLGLDIVSKRNVQKLIKEINKKYNITIIITTHDISEIEKVCKKIIIIDKGEIIYNDFISKLKQEYSLIQEIDFIFSKKIKFEIPKEISKNVRYLINEKKVSCYFNLGEISKSKIIGSIIKNYEIEDILIKKNNLEDIVLSIYEKGEKKI